MRLAVTPMPPALPVMERHWCFTLPAPGTLTYFLELFARNIFLVCKCCFVFGVAAMVARSLGPIVLYIKYQTMYVGLTREGEASEGSLP